MSIDLYDIEIQRPNTIGGMKPFRGMNVLVGFVSPTFERLRGKRADPCRMAVQIIEAAIQYVQQDRTRTDDSQGAELDCRGLQTGCTKTAISRFIDQMDKTYMFYLCHAISYRKNLLATSCALLHQKYRRTYFTCPLPYIPLQPS